MPIEALVCLKRSMHVKIIYDGTGVDPMERKDV